MTQDHSNRATSDLSLEGLEAMMKKLREPRTTLPMNQIQIVIPVDWAVGTEREFCEGRFLLESPAEGETAVRLRRVGPALSHCEECL